MVREVDPSVEITRSEMVAEAKKWSTDEQVERMFTSAENYIPEWRRSVTYYGLRCATPAETIARHIATIDNASELMRGWRSGDLKYVKKRRNEIDSAISYLRNTSLHKPVSRLAIAPPLRHLAGLLRGILYVAARGYHDDQLPALIAAHVYDEAAMRSFFPFDMGDLMTYGTSVNLHGVHEEDISSYSKERL